MLKVLPSHVSNLIAAGEVVQRPASVVKELMENAVDAGAKTIRVLIKDSGRTLIQVIDDGCGMSPRDAELAFERHATSKIEEIEDLEKLGTFGFRGEALASIASVAEITLRTRRAEDAIGFEVKFAESKLTQHSEISSPVGSNFIVRNIFYNIPARRKFLKSDSSEYRQILSEFTRVALTRPDLYFYFTNNGTEIYNLPPSNLRQRIQGIAGKELGKELVELSVDTTIVKIKGYIGKPEDSRKTPGNQYFFVNGRFFRSPYFQKAILKAYENLIQDGTIPSFFIFFEADQERIDVNIHPSKTEVKFEDDYAIFDILQSAARESLGKNSFMPSIDFDQEGAPEIPKVKAGYYVPPPKIDYDPLFNPFDNDLENRFERRSPNYSSVSSAPGSSGPLFNDGAVIPKPILHLAGRYIITTLKSGLLVIDIRRAQERILYERYMNSICNEYATIQQTLFPKELILSEGQKSVVNESRAQILQLGFDIREEDGKYRLCGIPEGFSDDIENIEQITDSLLEKLLEGGQDFGPHIKEQVALTLSRAGSGGILSGLNNLEAQALVDALFACKEPSISPSGKVCMAVLSLNELDNRLAL
ncbi:MAG: DNA mismatch repair endonuclease MutL [Bacteroidales bacterium]|nr:DNA mismatch repair endonuclease MutL [Bacteroidales bacterium]